MVARTQGRMGAKMSDATELARARAALVNIASVCRENAGANCRHDLALKFVGQVAADAMVSSVPDIDVLPNAISETAWFHRAAILLSGRPE